MHISCDNCGHDISLVGATELRDEFGITSNTVAHYRDKGFPTPVLEFGNRHLYRRSDVQKFQEDRSKATVQKTVESLAQAIQRLPEAEQTEARRLLEERLVGTTKPAKAR